MPNRLAVPGCRLAVLTLPAALMLGASGCERSARDAEVRAEIVALTPLPEPQEAFWRNLRALCGQAFEGRLVDPQPQDSSIAPQRLVMHVRECADTVTYVPFHVGEDRSRTWWIVRTGGTLRLKHDHRHADGSYDAITWYGGDAAEPGSATRQQFQADEYTAELLPPAAVNVWTIELLPGERYTYMLQRTGTDRRFEAGFDLTRQLEPPPAPWGW